MEYHLFISHSWQYFKQYDNLMGLLDQNYYFNYSNYSVPHDEPLTIYNKSYYEAELRNKIKAQMKSCHVVIVLAGVYASYSDNIQLEIDVAQELNKPIIAVIPRGACRISTIVRDAATDIVKWNSDSLVTSIREYSL